MEQIGEIKLFIRVINYKLIDDGTISRIVNISKEDIYKIVDYELFIVTDPKDTKYKKEDLIAVETYIKHENELKALTGLDAMKFLFKERNINIDDFCIESLPLFSSKTIKEISYKDEKYGINSLFELYKFIDDNNEAFVKLVGVDNYQEVLSRYKDLQEVVTNFYKNFEFGE